MKPTRPSEVQKVLLERRIFPSTALGQSFLIDAHIRDQIVAAAALKEGDRVLEIGPGLGVLTGALLETGASVVAVEKDAALCDWLQESLGDHPRFTLIRGDFLRQDIAGLSRGAASVVSNLPYSAGSRMLMEFFALDDPPPQLVVTVQREVGERMAAPPGGKVRGLLGVWAQLWYRVQIVRMINPSCFMPRPQVFSAVMRLQRLGSGQQTTAPERKAFRALTKAAFAHRRKQLGTVLGVCAARGALPAPSAWLQALGLDPRLRAEALSIEQWLRLARAAAPGAPAA